MKTEIVVLTKQEWMAKGKQLFGEDMTRWRFVCPGCGHIQSAGDFRQYKDKGATPDSARMECLGRYSGGRSWAFTKAGELCDYAGYGLLNICPIKVTDGEKTHRCFAFDEVAQAQLDHNLREG